MYDSPHIGLSAFLAGLAVLFFAIGNQLTSPILIALFGGLVVVAGIFSATLYIHWLLCARMSLYERKREADAVTPIQRAMQAARGLTDAQAALVPTFDYGIQVGYVYDGEGLESYLKTPGGDVPWDFVERYFRDSSYTHVMSTNRTSAGTDERRYVQSMTTWCVYHGFASPYDGGPKPAAWIGDGRVRAARALGVELDNVFEQ